MLLYMHNSERVSLYTILNCLIQLIAVTLQKSSANVITTEYKRYSRQDMVLPQLLTFLGVAEEVSDLVVHLLAEYPRPVGLPTYVGARHRRTHNAGVKTRVLPMGGSSYKIFVRGKEDVCI